MAQGRDWRMPPASFDGIVFYVDAQRIPGARRVITHEYPGSERWDNEDLGRCADRYELTAYFLSETADTDSAALRARLAQQGPGLLILPMFGAFQARVKSWDPAWGQEKLNYVGFSMVFIGENPANAPAPLGLGAATLAAMGSGLGATLGAAISTALIGQPRSGFARADMATAVGNVGAVIETARQSLVLPDAVSSAARTAIAASVLSLDGGPSVDPGAVAARLFNQLDAMVAAQAGAATPNQVANVLSNAAATLLTAASDLRTTWGLSPLIFIAPLAGAAALTAQATRALATAAYTNRQDAIAARARIAALADTVGPYYASLGADAAAAFEAMFGAAARYVSQKITNLAPILLFSLNASLPSNVLAWRLYGDPTRGQELVDRNQVETPCFMPTVFEAAAS
jgi:prophage DNA circulation protein